MLAKADDLLMQMQSDSVEPEINIDATTSVDNQFLLEKEKLSKSMQATLEKLQVVEHASDGADRAHITPNDPAIQQIVHKLENTIKAVEHTEERFKAMKRRSHDVDISTEKEQELRESKLSMQITHKNILPH